MLLDLGGPTSDGGQRENSIIELDTRIEYIELYRLGWIPYIHIRYTYIYTHILVVKYTEVRVGEKICHESV